MPRPVFIPIGADEGFSQEAGTMQRLTITFVLVAALATVALPATANAAKCGGKKAKIVRGGGDNKIRIPGDGHGPQVVYAGAGDDVIITGKAGDTVCGGPGNDLILAGKGKDRAFGGAGNDRIVNQKGKDSSFGGADDDSLLGGPSAERMDGGDGNDVVNGSSDRDTLLGGLGNDTVIGDDGSDTMFGEDGNDSMHGGGGGEEMQGGPGDDRLYGELLDDDLDGGAGNDTIVGSHGIDDMLGGPGDDLLRGGTNADTYSGGDGVDTASFADALPDEGGPVGVTANLTTGEAVAPGGLDKLSAIESLLGSAYNDTLTGNGDPNRLDGSIGADRINGATGDTLIGGPGQDGRDTCSGGTQSLCDTAQATDPRTQNALVYLDGRDSRDPALYVLGRADGAGTDDLTIGDGAAITVTSTGQPVTPLGGTCSSAGAAASCPAPPLGLIAFSGEAGNDHMKVAGNWPDGMTADLEGGPGSDVLEGGAEPDNLLSGTDGSDVFHAGGGSDVLIAEGLGGDVMDAGDGNDQLVSEDPCQGHDYQGDGGFDIAGFARYLQAFNGRNGVRAALGGTATDPLRPGCVPTQVRADNEILEGSFGPDELFGDRRKNPLIIGREGDDIIHGGPGADTMSGDKGADSLFGEGGYDTLEAQDGQRDAAINCGAGGGQALRDGADPKAAGCHKLKASKRKRKGR
jgi:Ca2+-binding RTX toxin-like protein